VKDNHLVSFPSELDVAPYLQPYDPAADPSLEPPEPCWYELYCVLVHSGTALGGHYFSYVQTRPGVWMEFNDERVREIDALSELRNAFGGSVSGASGYMLLYRAVESSAHAGCGVAQPEPVCELPASLLAEIALEDKEAEMRHAKELAEQRQLNVAVYYNTCELSLRVDCGLSVHELTQQAARLLQMEVPAGCLRLRRYDPAKGWSTEVFAASLTLQEARFRKQSSVLLESRAEGAPWPEVDLALLPMRFTHVPAECVEAAVACAPGSFPGAHTLTLRLDCARPLLESAEAVRQAFGWAQVPRLLLLDESSATQLFPSSDTKGNSLQAHAVGAGSQLWVEERLSEDHLSQLLPAFHAARCLIRVHFNTPCAPHVDSRALSAANVDFCHSVRVPRASSLAELKTCISRELGVPPDSFVTKMNMLAQQWKDDSACLSELNLVDGSVLYLENGRPLKPDEFSLRVYLYQHPREKARFTYLFTLPFARTCLIGRMQTDILVFLAKLRPATRAESYADVADAEAAAQPEPQQAPAETEPVVVPAAESVSEAAHEVAANGWGIRYLRIREKQKSHSGKIFDRLATLEQSLPRLSDGDSIAIQMIAGPERITAQERLLLLQHVREAELSSAEGVGELNPDKVRAQLCVGPVRDLVLRANVTAGAFKARLAELAQLPVHEIWLAKGSALGAMDDAFLRRVAWRCAADLKDSSLLKNEPLQMRGGDIFLFARGNPLSGSTFDAITSNTKGKPAARAPTRFVRPLCSTPIVRPLEVGLRIGDTASEVDLSTVLQTAVPTPGDDSDKIATSSDAGASAATGSQSEMKAVGKLAKKTSSRAKLARPPVTPWTCHMCTFENITGGARCEMCNENRPR
jgi:hypothetical protein